VVSAVAVTERPGEAKAAAVPLAIEPPLQVAPLKSLTVEPASAVPLTLTAVAEDGETGEVASELGAAGGVESLVKLTGAEQGEVLPAASVAVALQVLVVSAVAVTERPGEAKAAAVPLTIEPPLQLLPLKILTVEPASALPVTLTAVAEDGETGEVASELGAAGGVESLVKLTGAEQAETLPAASVAVAVQVLVELAPAVTEMPLAKLAAVPVATGEPVQVGPLKIFTVEPASALPVSVTAVDCDGEAGEAASEAGAAGGVESLT